MAGKKSSMKVRDIEEAGMFTSWNIPVWWLNWGICMSYLCLVTLCVHMFFRHVTEGFPILSLSHGFGFSFSSSSYYFFILFYFRVGGLTNRAHGHPCWFSRQVERRFHSWELNCQPLHLIVGTSPISSAILGSSWTRVARVTFYNLHSSFACPMKTWHVTDIWAWQSYSCTKINNYISIWWNPWHHTKGASTPDST